MTEKVILYIEDNAHNRRIVRKLLTIYGYTIIEAEDGRDAQAKIADVINCGPIKLLFNQKPLSVEPVVIMGGQRVSMDACVADRAQIQATSPTIKEILSAQGFNTNEAVEKQILVNVNNQPHLLTQRNFTLLVNGKSASLDAQVSQSDQIEFYPEQPTFYRIRDVVEIPTQRQHLRVNVDGRDIDIELDAMQVFMNGRQVKADDPLVDRADIRVYHVNQRRIMLSEIFRYIDLDPNSIKGKALRLLVDNQPAGFTTPLEDGSVVRIVLEDLNR